MALVVACPTVVVREDWMRKHMEGHESEKVWSYSRVSQLPEGTSIFGGIEFLYGRSWRWKKEHHIKTYETVQSHYLNMFPSTSINFARKLRPNQSTYKHVQCFHDFFLLTDTSKKQRYWDPVYMSQNFEFAGAAPPGVGEALDWCGREGWRCHSLEGAVRALITPLAWHFWLGSHPECCLIIMVYSVL